MHTNSVDRMNQRNCLNANLRQAARVILSLYMDEMRDSGLHGTQFTLLSTIQGLGQATIGQIAEFMTMDQTTVTRNISLLKKEGFVVTVPGEDRRQKLVSLTDEGRKIIKDTLPKWQKAQTDLWDQLGEEKALQLLELTHEITTIGNQR